MTVNTDTQEMIVSALMKNPYLFSICKSEMTEGYFTSPSCKVIYKALSLYYDKYKGMPRLNELLVMIDDTYYSTVGVNLNEVKDTCCRLWDQPEPDELFIKDKITDFLRKVRSSNALKTFVDQLKVNPNLESDEVVTNLIKALEVQLGTTKVFQMSREDQLKEARKNSVGSEDQSRIIPSFLDSLNQCLMFKGYQPSTVNMIVAPPGCFTGDTKVFVEGSTKTLEELYNEGQEDLSIYGYDFVLNSPRQGKCKKVVLTKYTQDLVEITVDHKYTIKCTPDHRILLRNGKYVQATDLSEYDSLMPLTLTKSENVKDCKASFKERMKSLFTPSVSLSQEKQQVLSFINRLLVEFFVDFISLEEYVSYSRRTTSPKVYWLRDIADAYHTSEENLLLIWDQIISDAKNFNHKVTSISRIYSYDPVPVYDIVESSVDSNFALALSDREGVFVHNCGKSMFLINEGTHAAKQGFEVLHVFIGDMVEYDGFIRYLSCISGTPQNTLVTMTVDQQMEIVNLCNQQYSNIVDKIFILAYPSLSQTVDTLIEDINRFEKELKKDFDLIIIDYPDNLILEGKSLYTDGGTLYSSLEKLARLSKSVILTASQPQKAYWSHQIIPLEAAAESSKKQQAVDVMLTMNTDSRGANFGTMLLAKARKGEVGKIFRFKTDFARCSLGEIDEGTFNACKAAYGIK